MYQEQKFPAYSNLLYVVDSEAVTVGKFYVFID